MEIGRGMNSGGSGLVGLNGAGMDCERHAFAWLSRAASPAALLGPSLRVEAPGAKAGTSTNPPSPAHAPIPNYRLHRPLSFHRRDGLPRHGAWFLLTEQLPNILKISLHCPSIVPTPPACTSYDESASTFPVPGLLPHQSADLPGRPAVRD